MKVAVTARGNSLEDAVDPRFGRCAWFVIVETDDMSYEAVQNENVAAGGGTGIQSAQLVADKGAGVVLTGDCGPNAYRTLEAADVRVITGVDGNVADAVRRYQAGEFSGSTGPSVQSHAGMDGQAAGGRP
jgi:predicted Fe-Mo cluster-binding NifX family protein